MPNQSVLSASDFVVVRAADLKAVQHMANILAFAASRGNRDGLLSNESPANTAALKDLLSAIVDLESETVARAVRIVDGDLSTGDNNGPVLLVIPPGMTEPEAIEAMNESIEAAGRATNDGQSGDYFEQLRCALSGHSIAIANGIERLESQPWDARSTEEQPAEGDPDWLNVIFDSSLDEPDEIGEGEQSDGTIVQINDAVPLRAFCSEFEFSYPRSDRYGVPAEATDAWGARYVAETLGVCCAADFRVIARDTGDDTAATFKLHCRVHRSCLLPVEQEQALDTPSD